MKFLDDRLNKITMYQLVFQSLVIFAVWAIIAGFLGWLAYSGLSLLYSLILILLVCYAANRLFAWIFKVDFNIESNLITALILFLILAPITTGFDAVWYVIIGTAAMASKYLLVYRRKHIFNPAAIALFITGLFGAGLSIWWVATPVLFPVILVFGVFILRKVQRFQMFFAFLVFSVASILVSSHLHGFSPSLKQIFFSWPIIFFGTVMLTEPLTTPASNKLRIAYGAIVGILFGLQFSFASPELALIVGNIFSFLVSPKGRLKLTLKEKNKLSSDTYEFVFRPDKKLQFKPGQYLEWTLGDVKLDSRGNRRYFTIASSPTEPDIKLGVKFEEHGSNFKRKLLELHPNDHVWAGELRGDFVLPEDMSKKLVFLAGGIGITPFRSMVKYLSDKGEKRDIVLLYSAKEFAYKDVFDKAEIKTMYATERVTEQTVIKEIPDYKDRIFYLSGPRGMVEAFEKILKGLGIPKSSINIDFFPGFA